MPSSAIWVDLEIIILREVKERQIYNIVYMCNVKNNDTNELIYKRETDSQTQKTNLWLPNGKGDREEQIRSMGLTATHL